MARKWTVYSGAKARLVFALCCAALLPSVPAVAETGISDDVVRIGILNDQSGPFAANGGLGSVTAAKMAVEDFGGKVLGKPIEIIAADHQNKPDLGAATAREWLDARKVDAIAEGSSSAVALAVQDLTRSQKRMFLMTSVASTELSGKACSPTGNQWSWDTYGLPNATAHAVVQQGDKSWFFITVDYTFGAALERDTTGFVRKAGGTVVGSVRHPLNTNDFSSYILKATSSGAKVIALANAGSDFVQAVKQAGEFGVTQGGKQRLVSLFADINDIHGLGLNSAKGLFVAASFYWNLDEKTREWSHRFMARHNGRAPSMVQAGTYAAITHYLKAIAAAGTDSAPVVARKMKELPVEDFYNHGVVIRADGRVMHKMYLFEVKSPAESKGPWDYYKLVATIPAQQAWRPLAEGECPFAAAKQ